MADSLNVSSARVAPRSVMRAAATSAITSHTLAAVDSTAPVLLASPTVRYRTTASYGTSPGSTTTGPPTDNSMPSRSTTVRVWV